MKFSVGDEVKTKDGKIKGVVSCICPSKICSQPYYLESNDNLKYRFKGSELEKDDEMKFKIGDHVRVIGNNCGGDYLLGYEGYIVDGECPSWGDYRVKLGGSETDYIFKESQLEHVEDTEFEWKVDMLRGHMSEEVKQKFANLAKETNMEAISATAGADQMRVTKTKFPSFKQGDVVALTGLFEGVKAKVGYPDTFLDQHGEVEVELLGTIDYKDGSAYHEIGDTIIYKTKYLRKAE